MYFLLRTFRLVEFSSETQVGKSGVLQSISARIFQLQVKNALCVSARQWLVTALKACPYGDSKFEDSSDSCQNKSHAGRHCLLFNLWGRKVGPSSLQKI